MIVREIGCDVSDGFGADDDESGTEGGRGNAGFCSETGRAVVGVEGAGGGGRKPLGPVPEAGLVAGLVAEIDGDGTVADAGRAVTLAVVAGRGLIGVTVDVGTDVGADAVDEVGFVARPLWVVVRGGAAVVDGGRSDAAGNGFNPVGRCPTGNDEGDGADAGADADAGAGTAAVAVAVGRALGGVVGGRGSAGVGRATGGEVGEVGEVGRAGDVALGIEVEFGRADAGAGSRGACLRSMGISWLNDEGKGAEVVGVVGATSSIGRLRSGRSRTAPHRSHRSGLLASQPHCAHLATV
jgi:hypothetical protein